MSTDPAELPVALVTGGTRGIGTAIVRILAPDHHVLIGGRDLDAASALAAELPSAEPFVADLTDEESTASAASKVSRLNVLVHSAGVFNASSLAEAGRAEWHRVMEVNLIAVADLTKDLLPALQAVNGQVIMINSTAGLVAGPRGGIYSASKFALRGYSNALREEFRGKIRVTEILPGRVDTDMQRELQRSLGREDHEYDGDAHLRPEAVAAAVRTAVDSPASGTIESIVLRPTSG